MMTVGELRYWLIDNDIPDDAVIYIFGGERLGYEGACEVFATKSEVDDPSGAVWEFEDYKDWYDENDLKEYARCKGVTAICFLGDNV